MPEIIWDSPERGHWNPTLSRIFMSDEPYFKERGPMVLAHEVGHWKYDQTLGDTDPLIDMMMERDAWRYALNQLPPDEIDLNFLEYSLEGYVYEVEDWYGKGPQLDAAHRMKNEIIALAKKKKGGY